MFVRQECCPKCKANGGDSNGDNLAIYQDKNGEESAHCFACGYTRASKQWLIENGRSDYNYLNDKEIDMGMDFTLEEIKKEYCFSKQTYRGIKPETYKHYGVMHKEKDGELIEQIYPTFDGGKK